MGGTLTTHVLDTARGRPAAGMEIVLTRLGADGVPAEELARVRTNADGRTDGPILLEDRFAPGSYELAFHVADWLRAMGETLPEPAFLGVVPIRFGMAEASHYHVPLLVSAYGYSTYRGS